MSAMSPDPAQSQSQTIEMATMGPAPSASLADKQTFATPSYMPPPTRSAMPSNKLAPFAYTSGATAAASKHSQSVCVRHRVLCFSLLAVLLTLCLLAAILIPIMILVVGQQQAQSAADALVLQFTTIGLSSPQAGSLNFRASVAMNSAGGYDTTIESFAVTAAYKGSTFGRMTMPIVPTRANTPTDFLVSSNLTLTSTDVFHEIAVALMAGQTVEWTISGKPDVSVNMGGLVVTYSVSVTKTLSITGAVLQALVASDVDTINGTASTLATTLTQTIYNPSIISLLDLEGAVFNVLFESTLIGTVAMPTFSISQGANVIPNCQATFTRTNQSSAALTRFLNNWTLGANQTIAIVGPIALAGSPEYLYGTINNKVVVIGNAQPNLVASAVIPIMQIIQEYLSTKQLHMGVNATLVNPLGVDVIQNAMAFDVSLSTPLPGFIARLPIGPSLTTVAENQTFLYVECGEGVELPSLSSGNQSVLIPANGSVNYEFPSIGMTDLCQAARLLGVYYSVVYNTLNNTNLPSTFTVPISTAGVMSSSLSGFSTDMEYAQAAIPFSLGISQSTLPLLKLAFQMLNIQFQWYLPGPCTACGSGSTQ